MSGFGQEIRTIFTKILQRLPDYSRDGETITQIELDRVIFYFRHIYCRSKWVGIFIISAAQTAFYGLEDIVIT